MHIASCLDGELIHVYDGNCTSTFKGEHRGCTVAVKRLCLYLTTDTNKYYRVSILALQRILLTEELQRFFREAVAWRHLQHPNILPLLGVDMDLQQHNLVMVSEWMIHGNINEFVEKKKCGRVERLQLVSEDAIFCNRIFNLLIQLIQVANGLDYMHSHHMVHGDLKGV